MKKFIKIFLSVIVSLIIIIGLFIGYMFITGGELDDSSKSFVDNSIPKILSTWDYKTFCDFSHPALIKKLNNKDFDKFSSIIRKNFGKYVKYNSSSGEATLIKTNLQNITKANYVSNVEFEKGSTDVSTELIYDKDKWHITKINIAIKNTKSKE